MINVVVVVSVVYYVMLNAQDKFTNHLEWFWKGIGQQQAY